MSMLRPALGIATAQLRHRWVRAVLGIIGVTVAVLATVLLLGLGFSVLEIGDAGFTRIGGDLWITGGATTFAPGTVGGLETGILDAHNVTSNVKQQNGVEDARALQFQSVYVGTEPGEYQTIVGAGVTGNGSAFQTTKGRSFSGANTHYANGSFDGPRTREVLLDRRAAALLDAEVGDTIHIGGTVFMADNNEYEVVGISNDIARYLGTPTVLLQLGELQRLTAQTGTDPATTVLVTVESGADTRTVQSDLQSVYERYDVRTNQEQFEAVLQSQSTILASGITVAILAVGSGIALVSNVLGLFVYQQRRSIAALRAIGTSTGLLLRVIALQGLTIAATGATLGLVLAWPAVQATNYAVEAVIGHEDLVMLPTWVLIAGTGIALSMGLIGSLVGGWLVTRVSPLEHLGQ